VVAIALIAVAQASNLHQPLQRWQQFAGQFPADARWTSAKTAISALPEAGWFGFGPGTFRAVFPYHSQAGENGVAGIWRFLHEDYLQFLLEWGAIGSAFWGVLFFGGMVVAFRAVRRPNSSWLPRQRTLIPLVLLALASVALHALVDFPLQIASIQLYVATYLGICWGSSAWKRS
jgi:O-antigen ligase